MTLSTTLKCLSIMGALLLPALGSAEDIDIFQGNDLNSDKSNVLIFVDNSANWNRNDQGWPVGKQGESELEAMNTVIGTLTGSVRVGVMFFVKGPGSQPDGGYVRFGIRDMDTGNRQALQNMLTGIYPSFNDQNDGQQVASANSKYGEGLYEVYKYFSGATPYAGQNAALRDFAGNGSPTLYPHTAGSIPGNALAAAATTTPYTSPLSADAPCAKNFLIFIGNGFPSNSSDAPSSYGDPTLSTFNANQIYDEGNKITYADEWSRHLYQQGVSAPCIGTVCANNKIISYTIDVYKDHQDTNQTALLKSMAAVGGGKYFAATSTQEIKDALQAIFNEIQAVNSVFTSASLPVSVNTQGTYLNQIYMGVFRPDGTSAPRWQGNLKQYQFGLTTDAQGEDTIFLADSTGAAAVNTLTGFVSPNARSYWTTAVGPACTSDTTKGFWCFSPSGVGADKDLPDGDLVEKGAAAQKLRVLGPTARTMYTCTPNCTSGTTPASWIDTNTSLVTTLSGTSANITALSRSGPLVTVTTSADLGLATPTDTVTISGSSVAAYNTSWSASKVDATHFTFTVPETPATPATGSTITAAAGSVVTKNIASGSAMTMDPSTHVVAVNLSNHGFITGQTVTIAGARVSSGSPYGSADMATATTKCTGWVAGVDQYKSTPCEYNGTFAITKIDDNNFTYVPPTGNFGSNSSYSSPLPAIFSAPLGTATLKCNKNPSGTNDYTNMTITSITRTSTGGANETVTVVFTAPAMNNCSNPLVLGTAVKQIGTGGFAISGSAAVNNINGTYTLASVTGNNNAGAKTVTFTVASTSGGTTTINPAATATLAPTATNITASGQPTYNVTSITRTAGNVATVTVTTSGNHGLSNGSSVTIAGANQTEYNGTFAIANATGNTFTYTLTTGPAVSATGGTVAKGSTLNASTLINWVRGVDNKEDENANNSLTDVRASIHGDVLHSRPVVINYGGTTGIYSFYGSNDGMLHAIKGGQDSTDATLGTEAWSFVAPEHYSKLGRLYLNKPLVKFPNTSTTITPTPTGRDYFFDGNIGVFQTANLATTHIYVSMRRGGRGIYAFDVSDPTSPKFLWKKFNTDTDFSELGQTWSEPKVIPIRKTAGTACNPTNDSTYTRALVFGAGYDPIEEDKVAGTVRTPTMGRGIFVVDATDGSLIKQITLPYSSITGITNSTKRYSVPSEVTVIDTNGDGCIDRLYVGDTGANLFRADIGSANPNDWKTYKLAALGDIGDDGGDDSRKILYPPDVVLGFIGSSQIAYVLSGTGDREQPFSTGIHDMFFMVKDTLTGDTSDPPATPPTPAPTVTTLKLSDLEPVTDFNATDGSAIDPTLSTIKGWYLELKEVPTVANGNIEWAGEKVVNAPLTVGGTTFFGTNRQATAVEFNANALCSADLGVARGYAINFLNGTAAYTRLSDPDARGNLYANFTGGGLPPSPVSGVVQIGDKTVRFVIGGGGTGTDSSPIEGTKIQASPSSRRTRAFWYFNKDD